MKNAKGVLALLLCAVLLVGATVAGTVAYLTDSKVVKNTFTVGKVGISLQEYKINGETGEQVEPTELVAGNAGIRMIPGRTIKKEPVLTVLADSEACYVRMFVKITWPEEANGKFKNQEYAAWFKTNGNAGFGSNWTSIGLIKNGVTDGDGVDIYEFRYNTSVNKSDANTTLDPLFTAINIPGDLSNEQIAAIDGSVMELIAQAVQAEGFNGVAAAFEAVGYPDGITVTQAAPEPENP